MHTQIDLSLALPLSLGVVILLLVTLTFGESACVEHSVLSSKTAQLHKSVLNLKDRNKNKKSSTSSGVRQMKFILSSPAAHCTSTAIFFVTPALSQTVWQVDDLTSDRTQSLLPSRLLYQILLTSESMYNSPHKAFPSHRWANYSEVWEQREEAVSWCSPTVSSLGHRLLLLCLPPLHLTAAGVELSSSNQLKEEKQEPRQI